MNKKIKIGILGYSGFGKFIYTFLYSTEYVEVITIAYERFHKGMPDQINFYHYWEKMITLDELDVALISHHIFRNFIDHSKTGKTHVT